MLDDTLDACMRQEMTRSMHATGDTLDASISCRMHLLSHAACSVRVMCHVCYRVCCVSCVMCHVCYRVCCVFGASKSMPRISCYLPSHPLLVARYVLGFRFNNLCLSG